jgi:hypothetical protein
MSLKLLFCYPRRLPWPTESNHYSVRYVTHVCLWNTECSLYRIIRRPEHLIGRHWHLPENWRPFIQWSSDQLVSQCYAIECYRSFYCALFCVFMTRVSQCPITLRSEHPISCHYRHVNNLILTVIYKVTLFRIRLSFFLFQKIEKL